MAIKLGKEKNKFIKKSFVIVRTITNDTSGLLTQRLFNFAISSIKFNTNFNEIIKVNLSDFCIFHKTYSVIKFFKSQLIILKIYFIIFLRTSPHMYL